MNAVPDEETDRTITRVLGEELRRARDDLGWTRAELVSRMPSNVHVQTLAYYEQGLRQCTVVRLVEICKALGVSAPELLGLALQRAEIDLHNIALRVDLHALLEDKRTELRPLRRWARNRLADAPDASGVARLDRAVIDELALFLGFTRAQFVRYLVGFTPNAAPRRPTS